MKDLKRTLRDTRPYLWEWFRLTARDYVILAMATTAFAYSVLQLSRTTLLPLWLISQETEDWELIRAIIGIDVGASVATVLTLAAICCASWRAHHTMRRIESPLAKLELSSRHRGILIFETLTLMCFICAVLWLPVLTIFLSSMSATRTSLFDASVATPFWSLFIYGVCTSLAMYCSEVAMTFCRLCFRIIPSKSADTDAEDDQVPPKFNPTVFPEKN